VPFLPTQEEKLAGGEDMNIGKEIENAISPENREIIAKYRQVDTSGVISLDRAFEYYKAILSSMKRKL